VKNVLRSVAPVLCMGFVCACTFTGELMEEMEQLKYEQNLAAYESAKRKQAKEDAADILAAEAEQDAKNARSSTPVYPNNAEFFTATRYLSDADIAGYKKQLSNIQAAFEKAISDITQEPVARREIDRLASQATNEDSYTKSQTLNSLVLQWPDNSFVYLARGLHHKTVGFQIRGRKFASEVPPEDFKRATQHWSFAREDFKRAYSLNPKNYLALIGEASLHTRSSLGIVEEALARQPASFWAYSVKLNLLLPNWFGSVKQQKQAISEAKRVIQDTDQIARLERKVRQGEQQEKARANN